MKWKMTLRYLLSILMIVFLVFIVNTIILFGVLFFEIAQPETPLKKESAEAFTRAFKQYLTIAEDGNLDISSDGIEALVSYGAEMHVLDLNGTVVAAYNTDREIPTHYSPIHLVHNYKYMDEELNTYFISEFEDYNYLILIPEAEEQRFVFTLNSQKIMLYLSKVLMIAMFANLLIAAIVGLFFSQQLTKPIYQIIERINGLKDRIFHAENPKKVGIFNQVFSNLNDVAKSLQAQDIERKKLEMMRDEWIRNVSHDIRTPLSSIRGYAELLRNDDVSYEERLEYAEVIERQSLYMRELLDDFQLTMKLRSQQLPLQLQPTKMEYFMRELVIDLLNDKQFQHAQIEFSHDEHTSTWEIDRHLMKRALLNFLHNALLHNPEDVQISVHISEKMIIIADNGKGISENEQEQVFERYYRGTNTTDIQGTGLGMAIARDIIQAHHGTIELESKENEGMTIRIILPAT